MLNPNDSLYEYLRVEPNNHQHNQGEATSLIDPELLFLGNYKRSGDHLHISVDGREILIRDYFLSSEPKDLFSTEGAVLRGEVVKALAGPLVKAQYAQAAPAPAEKPIGRVESITGAATITRANGTVVDAKIGDLVYRGDVVQTGGNSSIGIGFVDGTAFSMNSQARMVLNEFVFDPNGSSNSAVINLVQGTISFVAGKVAKTGDMKLGTPVATMGIRGTALQIEISSSQGPTAFYLMLEPGNVSGIAELYSPVTGQLIATVSDTGIVTFVTPDGQIRQEPKTNSQLQQEQLIVQQLFNIISIGQQNPIQRTDANPQGTSYAGTPGVIDSLLKLANVELPAPPTVFQLEVPKLSAPEISIPEPIVETVTVTITPVTNANAVEDQPDSPDASGGLSGSANYIPQTNVQTNFGTFSIDAAGAWTYDVNDANPTVNALAPGGKLLDVITVTRTDGSKETIVVTINGVNDAPVLTGTLLATVEEGGAHVITAGELGFTDPDDAVADVTFTVSDLAHGVVKVNGVVATTFTGAQLASGLVSFEHDGSEAPGSFDVFVEDGNEDGSTPDPAKFMFYVTPINDAPTANDDAYTVSEDSSDSFSDGVLDNDIDPDGPVLTAQPVTGPSHGALQLNPDGSFTYTPEQNFSGLDTFTYGVSDGTFSDTATVTLTVKAVNDAPVIITPDTLKYWTSSADGNVTAINQIIFADADAGSDSVTVTFSVDGGAFNAANAAAIGVSGSGTNNLTLSGSIAAINAYIALNQILFDPPDHSLADRIVSVSIFDNDDTDPKSETQLVTLKYTPLPSFNGSQILDFHDVNVMGPLSVDMAPAATNTLVTSWNHLGPEATFYDAGDFGGLDTGTLVFSPAQFEEVLANADFRGALDIYLDGTPGTGTSAPTLNLDDSSWNASIRGIETAHVALAAGDTYVTTAITNLLPDYMNGLEGTATNDILVGSSSDAVMNGNAGNDILVGLGGDDTLNGGNGSDILLGGTGKDVLNGGTGTDILWGGADSDTFYFQSFNNDTVLDFVHGEDKIKFDVGAFNNFSDLLAHAAQAGSDVVIDDPHSSNVITLKNVVKGTLTHNDFILS